VLHISHIARQVNFLPPLCHHNRRQTCGVMFPGSHWSQADVFRSCPASIFLHFLPNHSLCIGLGLKDMPTVELLSLAWLSLGVCSNSTLRLGFEMPLIVWILRKPKGPISLHTVQLKKVLAIKQFCNFVGSQWNRASTWFQEFIDQCIKTNAKPVIGITF
jgi:hypothetical protein